MMCFTSVSGGVGANCHFWGLNLTVVRWIANADCGDGINLRRGFAILDWQFGAGLVYLAVSFTLSVEL